MDQNKFSLIEIITKFLHQIKQVVVIVLVLIAATSLATAETTNEPPYSVTSPPPKTEPKLNLQMAISLACLLTALLLVCFFFFYFRRYAERQLTLAATTHRDNQRTATKLVAASGLDPAVIAAFTSFTYSTVKDIKIGQQVLECAVCLNEFDDHEALRLLPECNHVFHRGCIDEWLASHVTCPVCRVSLVPKPSQLGQETELPCGQNRHTKDHVSVELVNLKHNLAPPRKLSRSCSMGHMMSQRAKENVDRYRLRLPDEVQNVLKNTVSRTVLPEGSLKTSLKSASANFVRGSNYFDYERFDDERRSFGITGSFNTRSGSGSSSHSGSDCHVEGTSERFLSSPLNRLLHISNKDAAGIMMIRLNDS